MKSMGAFESSDVVSIKHNKNDSNDDDDDDDDDIITVAKIILPMTVTLLAMLTDIRESHA